MRVPLISWVALAVGLVLAGHVVHGIAQVPSSPMLDAQVERAHTRAIRAHTKALDEHTKALKKVARACR